METDSDTSLLLFGFPRGSVVKNLPANAGDTGWCGVQSLGWEDPWEEGMQPTPVFMPGKSHHQQGLVGYSPLGCQRVGHDLATEHIYYLISMLLGFVISAFYIY